MASCEHCGTEFSAKAAEDRFCCRGCEYVAALISEQGFERLYDLKQGLAVAPVRSRPFEEHDFFLAGDQGGAAPHKHTGALKFAAGILNKPAGSLDLPAGALNKPATAHHIPAGAQNFPAGVPNQLAGALIFPAGVLSWHAGVLNESAGARHKQEEPQPPVPLPKMSPPSPHFLLGGHHDFQQVSDSSTETNMTDTTQDPAPGSNEAAPTRPRSAQNKIIEAYIALLDAHLPLPVVSLNEG
jgi:hypothetical protein